MRDLLGAGGGDVSALYVPPDIEPDGTINKLRSLGSSVAAISPRGVERMESAAHVLAAQAVAPDRRGRTVPCTPAGVVDAACAAEALRAFGGRAWRRPLTDVEVGELVDVSGHAAEVLGDFYDGLTFGIAGVIMAPDMIYRPELGEGGAYTGYEVASRLSFLLWDTIPDEALLAAAAAGELDTPEGVSAQARRMLDDPRVVDGLDAWVSDTLHLAELGDLFKDPRVYVQMSDGVAPAAREETLRLFRRVVLDEDADLRTVMTTRDTEIDRTLATIYGVRAPAREGFGLATLPDDTPRLGLLGHASFLAINAHPTSTSATERGLFVREVLLCQAMLPPPAGLDTSIPEATETQPTRRERVQVHLEEPGCSSCHLLMDPIGLGLENFDGIGVWRDDENGAVIDASGDLDGITFDDAEGLAHAIVEHPDFVPCLVRQVARNALGHDPTSGEQAGLDALTEAFIKDGHSLQGLWLELVASPLFLQAGEVSE